MILRGYLFASAAILASLFFVNGSLVAAVQHNAKKETPKVVRRSLATKPLAVPLTHKINHKEHEHHKIKNNIDLGLRAKLPGLLSLTQEATLQSDGPLTVPDSILAVGEDRIILCVNSSMAIYNKKSLEQISVFSFVDELWTPEQFPINESLKLLTDPWVIWDEVSQRFWITAFNPISAFTGQPQSPVFLAVSKGSSPNGPDDFYLYQIMMDGLPDYQKIAVDKDVLYFSNNFFALAEGQPTDVPQQLLAYEKAPLLEGGSVNELYSEYIPSGFGFDLQFLGPVQPRLDDCGKSGRVLFVQPIIDDSYDVGDTIRIHWIDNVLTNPQRKFADVKVSPFYVPSNVVQAPPLSTGSESCPLTEILPLENDGGIINTGAINGHDLWVTHSVLSDDGQRCVSRWYQFDISHLFSRKVVSLVQEGNVDDGVIWSFYPAINVDKDGNMGIAFSYAGPLNYPSVGYTGRLKHDPKGTVRMPIQVVSRGELYYQSTQVNLSTQRNRYGDYSGLVVDPCHKTFYMLVEDPQEIAPSCEPQGFVGAITPSGAQMANTLAAFEIHDEAGDTINAPQQMHLLNAGVQSAGAKALPKKDKEKRKREIKPRF